MGDLQPEYEDAPPVPAALVESLRGVGYSAATAIADIVDNSISAKAKNVWLSFAWDAGMPLITILDDGLGMSSTELRSAMRLGGRGPNEERASSDLGRFGLGLKTASFAMCRRVTVASRVNGDTAIRTWDLDQIADKWQLLVGKNGLRSEDLAQLNSMEQGTLVVWQKLDRIAAEDTEGSVHSEAEFLEVIDRVEEYLAMVFHRYLEGSAPDLRIFINGREDRNRVRPWDPFAVSHSATIVRPLERIRTRQGYIEVRGYVLPHKDQLSKEDVERYSGPDGWTAQQGFYVYRNRRMLVAGSWLGLGIGKLWTKEEAHKLARLRLDLPNSADFEWRIDIKKSSARPPQYLRQRLRALADDARQIARDVFAHRGDYGRHAATAEFERVWKAVNRKDSISYRVERSHPSVAMAIKEGGESVEAMLRLIELTVPVQKIWLDVVEKGEVQAPELEEEATPEIKQIAQMMFESLCSASGLSEQQARDRLLRTEPFQRYRAYVNKLQR